MSQGTPYTQQSYKVSDSFPFKWINKKWKEGFYITCMATSHTRWAVVMSRNAEFVDQCVELDFQYPSGAQRARDALASRCLRGARRQAAEHVSRPHGCCVRPRRGHPPPVGRRLPHHGVRVDAGPGRLRAVHAPLARL